MSAYWVARKVFLEITRERRTLLFFFVAPMIVMTLIYFSLASDEISRVGVISRGASRLFAGEVINALEKEKDIKVVPLNIKDDEADSKILTKLIKQQLIQNKIDGVIYLDKNLIDDRVSGKRGTINIYVEGSRPSTTGNVLSAVAAAMDDLAEALPVIVDPTCSGFCANSFNNKTLDLKKKYMYASEDERQIDFYLPMFPAFIVFFFTFITSMITFHRERARGTLERLLMAPISYRHIILGYIGGFLIFSGLQACIILGFVIKLVHLDLSSIQIGILFLVTFITLLIGLICGLFVSFLANNEFQAMQFIPVVILPQVFLCDMVWPISSFPLFFQWLAKVMPLTYANTIIRNVLIKNTPLWHSWSSLIMLMVFFFIVLSAFLLIANRSARLK